MDNKAATLLQKYAQSNSPKYGPSDTDMSNGPGGASATNMKYSRGAAKVNSQVGKVLSGLGAVVRDQGTKNQQRRSIAQMKQVRDIYNQATNKLKKKIPVTPIPHGNFNPDDQGI